MKPSQHLAKYLKNPCIRRLYGKVKAEYAKRGPIAHGWDHIYRDIINAIWIGEAEGADMNIVIPAVILHDIDFLYDPHPAVHAVLGAEKCYEWLGDWNEAEKQKIKSCIETHKGKGVKFQFKPKTLEEKVIYDADQLEKMGYLGVLGGVRALVEFAESSIPKFKLLYEIAQKLSTMKKVKMYTAKGRELARKRGGIDFKIARKALKELEEYQR